MATRSSFWCAVDTRPGRRRVPCADARRPSRRAAVRGTSSGRTPAAGCRWAGWCSTRTSRAQGRRYALTDQAGNIQRYVEAVPGIDLEPYVGYVVKIRDDTGRTLLATQVLLPGHESQSMLDERSAAEMPPTSRTESLLRGLWSRQVRWPAILPEGMSAAPRLAGAAGAVRPKAGHAGHDSTGHADAAAMVMQGMPMQQGMPPMMGPQGMVNYDPNMGDVPAGDGPIYLDGPMPCGPQGCPCPQPVRNIVHRNPVRRCMCSRARSRWSLVRRRRSRTSVRSGRRRCGFIRPASTWPMPSNRTAWAARARCRSAKLASSIPAGK